MSRRIALLFLAMRGLTLAFLLVSADPQGVRADLRQFDEVSFKLALQRSPLVALDFHTTFCKLCRSQSPILERALQKADGWNEVEAFLVDFEKNPRIRNKLDVQYPTTILFFHKGKEVKRVAGELRHEVIEQAIRSAFEEVRSRSRK